VTTLKQELASGIELGAIASAEAHGAAVAALTLNDQRKQRLSGRLRSLMDQRGLSVSVAAKLVQEQLPGSSFNATNISHYRAGRSMPRPRVLRALGRVLGVDPEDLTSTRAGATEITADDAVGDQIDGGMRNLVSIASLSEDGSSRTVMRFHVTDLPDGEALLRINQKLSWSTVIRILKVLKEDI
jgi:transcriptional regulator with XRE-family HTH domain